MTGAWREYSISGGMNPLPVGTKIYQREVCDGHLQAFVSHYEDEGWHMSMSHRSSAILNPATGAPAPGRIPTWEEIRDARYDLLPPDVTFALLLPPRDQYVNVHPTTMHLWQVPAEMEEGPAQ